MAHPLVGNKSWPSLKLTNIAPGEIPNKKKVRQTAKIGTEHKSASVSSFQTADTRLKTAKDLIELICATIVESTG